MNTEILLAQLNVAIWTINRLLPELRSEAATRLIDQHVLDAELAMEDVTNAFKGIKAELEGIQP